MILMPRVESDAAFALYGDGVVNNGFALHGISFLMRDFAMQLDEVA
jgi:hypothetical protein